MPSWSDFVSSLSSGAGAAVKRLSGGGAYLSPEELAKEKVLNENIKSAIAGVDSALNSNPLTKAAKAKTKQVGDILLKTAINLNNEIISPLITRPAATLGLLADKNSPLYKKDKYEQGFQFSDIEAAYNRSKKVSTFQAITKSNLIPLDKLSDVILSQGGIDINKVNLWNDESIKENYVDNAVGRWFTGVGDFVVGNKVFGLVGKAGKAAVIGTVLKPAGLYTKGKTVAALATDMDNGIKFASTDGAEGIQTASGTHAVALAQSKDWGVIEDIVTKYSTNQKLIPIIHEASDAGVVKDILLADKGDIAALTRLAAADSSKLFDIADVKTQIRNQVLETGNSYIPSQAAIPRLQKAFDDAIAANPQFAKIRDAFFDKDYELTVGGKAYMPMEPKLGKSAFIKGQQALLKGRTTIRNRQYDLPNNAFFETKIGETLGGWGIHAVRFAGRGTEVLPTGFVSFSGMRPLQARVELNAFLNNMKLFRDGNEKIVTGFANGAKVEETVFAVRQRMEQQFMETLGQGSVKQGEALKAIDAEVGKLLAYKNEIYSDADIANYIKDFQGKVSSGIGSVRDNGFGFTHTGDVILADPQTQRQLMESYRFTPWDDIEREIGIRNEQNPAKKLGKSGLQAGKEVFTELNRLWTFDVLARPSYALKQSLFEPIISSGLSQGLTFVYDDIFKTRGSFALRNLKGWSLNKISTKVTNKAELKKVTRLVEDRAKAHSLAIRMKETAQASVEELLNVASPATKAQHLPAAIKELKAASKLLDEEELRFLDAIVPYGAKEAIPSVATLERRINYLSQYEDIDLVAINEAQDAIDNYRNIISKLATNKQAIIAADDAVEASYKKIDEALKSLGEAQVKQADVFGKNAAFKKRYYARETQVRTLENGEVVTINSFVQDPVAGGTSAFTDAVRGETQNGRTSEINFLGELATAQTFSMIKRKRPMARVTVADPTYYEELAHIANRHYRGDPLMDLIMSNKPMSELQTWANSTPGKAYLKQFGVHSTKEVPSYLADKVALVNRMFPSEQARAAIVNKNITSQELQTFLAPYVNELFDIIPANHDYAATAFGVGAVGKVTASFDNTVAKAFNKLASVENPIRAAMFDKLAIDNVARKADYLMSQGVEMTTTRYNSLRQAAGREALQEMEKTLYTINNPNRFVNSLRVVTAFPGANINAFMRYGRLAAKNPVRATGFLYNYGRAFETFGVDENGNPTNDIDKISHLVIPGTKDLGLGPKEAGIALSAQSLGFLINRPSPSFVTSISIGTVMQAYPKTEKQIEELMTVNGTNYYKVFYPYGVPTSFKDVYTPPWAKSFRNWIQGPEGNADYLSSWKSIYNYHAMLVEMGIQEDMPSDKQIRSEVRSLFGAKFVSSFSSVFAGIPYKVDNNPMGLVNTLYYKIQERNNAAGMSPQDARDAAGQELLSLLGPNFMLDRVTFTGSSKNLNLPATEEAYSRVFSDNNELVGKLANIEPGEIGLVSLLTADLSYDPAEQSNNVLKLLSNNSLTLPGTTKKINELKMNPKEIEIARLKQRTWSQYIDVKKALEAKITDGKTLRSHPELKAVLENLATTVLKDQSQAWYDEYQLAAIGDKSYKYARALTEITSDEKFMKSNSSQFWKDTTQFLGARQMFVNTYQSLPDYDTRKGDLMDNYNAWVASNVGQWDRNLQEIVSRYFENDKLKAVN
jgi:hypothetical protein